VIVAAAPGIGIEDVVATDDDVADVTEIVGKDGGAETGRERNAGILIFALRSGGDTGTG
jgi:hypothetical protein